MSHSNARPSGAYGSSDHCSFRVLVLDVALGGGGQYSEEVVRATEELMAAKLQLKNLTGEWVRCVLRDRQAMRRGMECARGGRSQRDDGQAQNGPSAAAWVRICHMDTMGASAASDES